MPFAALAFPLLSVLPERCCNESCSGDGGNSGIFLVIVLDAFEPLQVHNAIHGQRQADTEESQSHVKPPTAKEYELKAGTFILDWKKELVKYNRHPPEQYSKPFPSGIR